MKHYDAYKNVECNFFKNLLASIAASLAPTLRTGAPLRKSAALGMSATLRKSATLRISATLRAAGTLKPVALRCSHMV